MQNESVVTVCHRVERQRGVGVRTAGPHLGGHPGLHDLSVTGPFLSGPFGSNRDAVLALRRLRDRRGQELLCLYGERALGESLPAKCLEGLGYLRCQFGPIRL